VCRGTRGPGVCGGTRGPGVCGGTRGPGVCGGTRGLGVCGGTRGLGVCGGTRGPGVCGGTRGLGVCGGTRRCAGWVGGARMSALERGRRPPEPRVPASSQLGLRVALLGGFALLMFGVIFFRLWYLQVLTGEQYVQQAAANTEREVPIAPPRGQILGRDGETLVTSKVTNAVQIIPSELPPAGPRRRALYHRLGHLLGMSPHHIIELQKRGLFRQPFAPVTIETDAGRGVMTVLGERRREYPGVQQEPITIREYPLGETAAQLFGYVRPLTEEQIQRDAAAFKGVPAGEIVGQSGLEYYYDRYLRGTPGIRHVEVNASGQVQPATLPIEPPRAGYNLRVSLDLPLQREGEIALRKGMELAHGFSNPGNGGAFLAMNPLNGEILAMGSYPTFNPNQLIKPLTARELRAIEEPAGAPTTPPATPFVNRAVEGAYPTGSTFKPLTAIASLEAGILNPYADLGGGSCIETVGGEKFCNSGHNNYGALPLVEALKVSSDTYFFTVGELDNPHGNVIQNMAHRLGIARSTGIDLPTPQIEGVLPTPQWRAQRNHLQEVCERHHPKNQCGYVAEIRPWSEGDDMDLAVGQGDLETNPLQMAVAYSTLANAYRNDGAGTVVTPHLGVAIENPGGGIVQALNFPPQRHIHFNPTNVGLVMEGIHDAASENGGTSADVWLGWNQSAHPVYGKTGTAERAGLTEQAWYMCYVGDPTHPIVIAVTVEQGGFGDQAAAPVARLIASKWFHQPLKLVAGTSADK
jgi:penicillin-binding protein 2